MPRHSTPSTGRSTPPGWWRATAARVGEDPKASLETFKSGAYLVVTTAASIYLSLIGVTKLLLPAPEVSRVEGLLYLIAALAIIPLWWRRVFAIRSSGATHRTTRG